MRLASLRHPGAAASIAVACVAGASALLVDCLSPTQITLVITTDVPCARVSGVEIRAVAAGGAVDDAAAVTSTTQCTPGANGVSSIGTIALVPSASKSDHVLVEVLEGAGADVARCAARTAGDACITAKRAVGYLPHTPLTLEIALRDVCRGIVCDPTSTCENGACVAIPVCGAGGCTPPPDAGAPPPDSAPPDAAPPPDAGAPPPDAGSVVGVWRGDLSGYQAGSAWPTRGGGNTRVSWTPIRGPHGAPTRTWSVANIAGGVTSSLVVSAHGTIFLGTNNQTVNAYDPTGALLWSTAVNGEVNVATPSIGTDGTLYVASSKTTLNAISSSGALLWQALGGLNGNTVSSYSTPAIAPDGKAIWMGGGQGSNELYTFDTGGAFTASPPIAGYDLRAPAAIGASGMVYLGGSGVSGGTAFLAYDPKTQSAPWSILLTDQGTSLNGGMPVLWDDGTGRETAAFITFGQQLYAFDLTTTPPVGRQHWPVAPATLLHGPAIGPGGMVVLGTNAGLFAYAQDGTQLWSAFTQDTFAFPPLIDPDGISYVASANPDGGRPNFVAALDRNGSTLWTFAMAAAAGSSAPAIGPDGTLYVGTVGGTLYALGP